MTRETPTLKRVMLAVGSREDCRCFRVNTGVGWAGAPIVKYPDGSVRVYNARPLRAGLVRGGSDIIGLQRILITPTMVGRHIGRLIAIETKSDRGETSEDQDNFLAMIIRMGGLAVVARSAEDATSALDGLLFDR